MAYIHNQRDPKIEESLLKGYDCTKQKMKEVLMKYGYNCEDIDSKDEEEKQTMKEFEENVKKVAKIRDEKYSIPYPILEEVKKILSGARRDSYGAPKDSFTRIAQYWNVYLTHKRDNIDKAAQEEDLPYEFLRGAYLTPKDAAMMMALFKIAREENKHSKDNIMDAIGYLTLANEMEE